MDFEFDEAQQVIAASAAEVLAGAVDAGGQVPGGADDWQPTWRALAKAGLLALTLPSWLDGDGLGVLDAAVLLTEVGRQATAVPAFATIMLGVLPVVRWGSQDLQARLLAGVGAGEVILTAAVREQSTGMAAEPRTSVALLGGASGSAGFGTVSGTKIGVPYAAQASWILVPARLPDGGRVVAVVDRTAAGIGLRRTPVSGDVPEYTVELAATPITGVLGIGERGAWKAGAAVDDLYQLAVAGAAAMADGAVAGALALTAKYVAARVQFGRPLATFQAVAQQVADVYIASRTLHLAALTACWRLSAGRDAADDTDVAAYWLAAEAPPALRTCHHLHGGAGLDISYPLHRYSAMTSDLTRFVGGADHRLELLASQAAGPGPAAGQHATAGQRAAG